MSSHTKIHIVELHSIRIRIVMVQCCVSAARIGAKRKRVVDGRRSLHGGSFISVFLHVVLLLVLLLLFLLMLLNNVRLCLLYVIQSVSHVISGV